MRAGRFYKHENNTDVAIELLKVKYFDEKRIKLLVSWWNVVLTPFPLVIVESIEIKREDQTKWKEILIGKFKSEPDQWKDESVHSP